MKENYMRWWLWICNRWWDIINKQLKQIIKNRVYCGCDGQSVDEDFFPLQELTESWLDFTLLNELYRFYFIMRLIAYYEVFIRFAIKIIFSIKSVFALKLFNKITDLKIDSIFVIKHFLRLKSMQ